MRILPVLINSKTPALRGRSAGNDGEKGAHPVYATLETPDSTQISTITRALSELDKVEFLPNDLIYVKNLGANPPFNNGHEAIEWIKNSGAKILYADFSNPKVHACLNYDKDKGTMIFINSNYKDKCSHSDVLAISEAIFHECGHGKDQDSENSIQEELNCLSLNVLAHRFYEKKYPKVFDNQNSFLYTEGVCLYPKLFFSFYKNALKQRIADKYGYLQSGDSKHPATKIADEIKDIYQSATYV